MTCKQIRAEALPVFYGENTFVYNPDGGVVQYDDGYISRWLKICETYLPLIRSVGVATVRRVSYLVSKDENPEYYEVVRAEKKERDEMWMSDHPLDAEEMAEIARRRIAKPATTEEHDDSKPMWVSASECYVVAATILVADDEVLISLDEALEDQCVCSLREGDWDSVIDRPRRHFVKYAMQYCLEELQQRLSTSIQLCETCGENFGTLEARR